MSTFTKLIYHVVFATKRRSPLITGERQPRLYEYLGGIIRGKSGHLVEVGGVADHVHLLVHLSPKFAVSDVIRDIIWKKLKRFELQSQTSTPVADSTTTSSPKMTSRRKNVCFRSPVKHGAYPVSTVMLESPIFTTINVCSNR